MSGAGSPVVGSGVESVLLVVVVALVSVLSEVGAAFSVAVAPQAPSARVRGTASSAVWILCDVVMVINPSGSGRGVVHPTTRAWLRSEQPGHIPITTGTDVSVV